MTTRKDTQGTQDKLRVFISYSKGDIGKVNSLYYVLRYFGFDPWIDEESILPGQNWEFEISKNISKSHVILVCLSSKAVNKSGYLHKEIQEP